MGSIKFGAGLTDLATPRIWNGSAFVAPSEINHWDGTKFVKDWPGSVPTISLPTLGSVNNGGELTLPGKSGDTILYALGGYSIDYVNEKQPQLNNSTSPLQLIHQASANNDNAQASAAIFKSVLIADGTCTITLNGYSLSSNSSGAVTISGYNNIDFFSAWTIVAGTTTITVPTPPNGGKQILFITFKMGSQFNTTITGNNNASILNDRRSAFTSTHTCICHTETTLNISPAVSSSDGGLPIAMIYNVS